MILLFYQINNGNVRSPAFFCAAGGFFLYRTTLSKLVMALWAYVAFGIDVLLRYLLFVACLPWRLLAHLVCRKLANWHIRYCKMRDKRARKRETKRLWDSLSKSGSGLLFPRDKEVL